MLIRRSVSSDLRIDFTAGRLRRGTRKPVGLTSRVPRLSPRCDGWAEASLRPPSRLVLTLRVSSGQRDRKARRCRDTNSRENATGFSTAPVCEGNNGGFAPRCVIIFVRPIRFRTMRCFRESLCRRRRFVSRRLAENRRLTVCGDVWRGNAASRHGGANGQSRNATRQGDGLSCIARSALSTQH